MRRTVLAVVSVAAAVEGARAGRDCKMTQAVGSSGALDEEAEVACGIMSRALVASLKGAKEVGAEEVAEHCVSSRVTVRLKEAVAVAEHGRAEGFTLCRKGRLLVDLAMEGDGEPSDVGFEVSADARKALNEAMVAARFGEEKEEEAEGSSSTLSPEDHGGGRGRGAAASGLGSGEEQQEVLERGSEVGGGGKGAAASGLGSGEEQQQEAPQGGAGAEKVAFVEVGQLGRPAFGGDGSADADFGATDAAAENANCYAYAGVSPWAPGMGAKGRFCHPGGRGDAPMVSPGKTGFMTCRRIMEGVHADGMRDDAAPGDGGTDYHEVAVFHHMFESGVWAPREVASHYIVRNAPHPDTIRRLPDLGVALPAGAMTIRFEEGFHDYHFHRRNVDSGGPLPAGVAGPELPAAPCWSDKNGELRPRPTFRDPEQRDAEDMEEARRDLYYMFEDDQTQRLGFYARFRRPPSLEEVRPVSWLGQGYHCGMVFARRDHFGGAACR